MYYYNLVRGTATCRPNEYEEFQMDLNKPEPTGVVNLSKGSTVDLAKPSDGEFLITGSWKNKGGGVFGKKPKKLDYDVFAHVAYTNGEEEVVNFDNLVSRNGKVRHHGDLTSGGMERISVELSPDIAAVGFSFYSARENGAGSFADAQASVAIDNCEGSRVEIGVQDMSVDPNRYTLYFGTIINGGAEAVRVIACEDYSERGGERRPVLYKDGTHKMDAGITNRYK